MYEIAVARVLKLVQNTGGYIDKQFILRKNTELDGLKEILHFIYNPYVKTGISSAKLNKALGMAVMFDNADYLDSLSMIEYLKGHQTGTDVDLAMAARYINRTKAVCGTEEPFMVDLAMSIVTQDLKIGVDVKTLNAVFGADFIPRVGCMFGTDHGKVNLTSVYWPAIATEKLDGLRRILIKENGSCRFFSRSGIEDTGLVEIAEEAKYLPNNCMYDGEVLAIGNFRNSIELRQATNSIANSKGIKHGLTFNVFDMVPLADFYAGKSKHNAIDRKLRLGATLMHESISHLVPDEGKRWEVTQAFGLHDAVFKCIKFVPILGVVSNMDQVTPIVGEIWRAGGEGVMLNVSSGLYEIKRSKLLLKVKHTEEHILEVTDMIEGTGKFEGMLGALVVNYNGNKLGVGSGFDDAMRRRIWDNPEQYIGKLVEVETFGESKNTLGNKSLNCPIFKGFKEED